MLYYRVEAILQVGLDCLPSMVVVSSKNPRDLYQINCFTTCRLGEIKASIPLKYNFKTKIHLPD